MDIIRHLKQTVSPAVLEGDRSPAKASLMEQFYAIFAARLADKDTYDLFSNESIASDDQAFYDRVWTDGTHRDQISRELAGKHNVDVTAARGMIAMAAPLAFHEIKSLAGTTPVPQFLRDNLASYQHLIPAWASAVLPASMLADVPAPASTAPSQSEEEKGGFMKALLPIIGLIILGALAWALLRGCQENPEPVATPAVTEQEEDGDPSAVAADVEPAALSIATGENRELYACSMNVGDEALETQVIDALTATFGEEANKCRADVDDGFAADMPASAQLTSILPIVKNVPNASMIIKGDQITVNAPDEAALDQLVADLQAAAPGMTVQAEGPLDLQGEVDDSLAAADAAMDDLGENPDSRDVARALSIQVINFEVDASAIPEVNKELLERASQIIAEVPDMELVIIGHTDSQASDDYNMALSRERAESVREYLVSHGIDASKLSTQGMGESEPVADNSTEQGRFRNRRIEFVVRDEVNGANNGMNSANDGMTISNDALDPDLNPLDSDNDDLLPDGDDVTQGTELDPTN
ncbi:OmpA family protein [Psychrobacter sp.]|uniref:OmpA family protein n=1 Tax=Psychrobacter sp. TaxID=56811 RepID=UPI0026476636|nr:OmpA family protein [Psychrobacter sp.]MDN6274855.1 OmpA family protein [Psychrobacter sp.]MDN6307079.1 OmpA family protein [Psychrobacter sp.]